jgi:uncharacterized protein (TIGR02300 family)
MDFRRSLSACSGKRIIMAVGNVATSTSRDQRGIKRMCVACEVAFYDLTRSPIVCPACGGEHTPVQRPVVELRKPYASTSAWRSRSPVPRDAVVPAAEAPDGVADGDEADEVVADDLEEADVPGAVVDDDTVLEHEADDADASALIEIEDDEPKDQ